MVIDCHSHWIPRSLADALRQRRTVPRIVPTQDGERLFTYQGNRPFDGILRDIEARRSFMRRHGVQMQVLSLPGLFGVDCLPIEESAPLIRDFNDAVIEVQRTYPANFAGLAALPLADMGLSCIELQRVRALGLRGAILPTDGFRSIASAMRFAPLFQIAERIGCAFFIHPGPIEPQPEVQVQDLAEDNAWQRRIVLQTQARLSEVMMTLQFSSYLDPYPNVSVQVANLGGTMPFLLERIEEVAYQRAVGDPTPMVPMRCYVDTASFGPRAIEMAVASFGANRVVLGTDCPIFDTDRLLRALSNARLDPETKERILFRNAQQLFPSLQ